VSGGVGEGAAGGRHAAPALRQSEELRLRPPGRLHAVRPALVDHLRHRDHVVPGHAPDEQHQAVHLRGRTRPPPAFRVIGEGGRTHVATVTGGKRPERERGAPFFTVNTLISNLSTALKATYKLLSPKHLPDYLGAFCWTTNHGRNMRGMIGALCCAAASASRLTRRSVYA